MIRVFLYTMAFMPVLAVAGETITTHKAPCAVRYVPGVDVHGKKVAPADVTGTFALPDSMNIDLDVGSDQMPIPALPEAKGNLGQATVDLKTGDVRVHGVEYKQADPCDPAHN
jgi:hypothetical protein